MRLIDVDELKKVLNSSGEETTEINISKKMPLGEIVDTVIQGYRKCLFAELDKMPTAYDVDKVVEQLKQDSQDIALIYPTDQGYDYDCTEGLNVNKATEIVKAGGVNE